MNELFVNKANRDKRAKELQAQGKTVRRSSVRNQLLHPEYLKDYDGGSYQRGFGNGDYKSYFPVLYVVDVIELPRRGGPVTEIAELFS